MSINLRLALALIAYAVLALLVWRTMADDKVRLITFAILAMLALRTITHAVRLRREAAEQSASQNGGIEAGPENVDRG